MKRILTILLTATILFPFLVRAESLFPAPDHLFGVTMPDMANGVGREPDISEMTDGGLVLSYTAFTVDEYDALDAYLAAAGMTSTDQSVKDNVLTTELQKDGASVILSYSYADRTASMTYPEGTRLERESHPSRSRQYTPVLPDIRRVFGAAIPDLREVLTLHPRARSLRESGTDMIRWTEVSIQDYHRINEHLTALGCSAVEWHADHGILYATMMYGQGAFTIRYELEAQAFSLICPELYYREEARSAVLSADAELVLPSALQAMGAILPRISTALLRRPNRQVTANEAFTEIYENFTPEDYAVFSSYLVDKGCAVDGYTLDDSGVLHISLTVFDVGFTFDYDQVNHRATVIYPPNAMLEPEFAASAAATPSPTPRITPSPTSRPTATPHPTPAPRNYDQDACWAAAEAYFWNLRWRNPTTVTIWSHWSSAAENGYVFYIDYSAMNGYGGYDRETYRITVNWATGAVEHAWSY